jgi:hypothetical protein
MGWLYTIFVPTNAVAWHKQMPPLNRIVIVIKFTLMRDAGLG